MTTESRRPVVYLIAQPTVSRNKPFVITPLYDHGDVEVLCLAGESPSYNALQALRSMERRFERFDPAVDFIVWAGGDSHALVLLGVLMAELGFYDYTWLRYERARTPEGGRTDDGAKYVPIRVNLSGWVEEGDILQELHPNTARAG